MGSCCGAVGRAVASNTRDPQFESRHRQFYLQSVLFFCIKDTRSIGNEEPIILTKIQA